MKRRRRDTHFSLAQSLHIFLHTENALIPS
jgi:hypothetical protein